MRTFRARVPYVSSCLRALSYFVATCLRTLIFHLPMSLRAYVLIYILRAYVPSSLKFEKIQEQVFTLLHNDFKKTLKKSGKVTMEIKRLGWLALEIFKNKNNLDPYYIKEIFSKTRNLTHRPLDIKFNQNNTTKYSLWCLGPLICDPTIVKSKRKSSMKNLRIM